jgi:transcription antitermination protein NusB
MFFFVLLSTFNVLYFILMVNRRLIREVVMQILYAYELRKEDIQKVSEGLIPPEILDQVKSKDFAFQLLDAVVKNKKDIDARIVKHADNWELDRMAIIDRNLMRMSIAEMLFFPDVPPKVSINEAIEIAKRFSTDKSSRFVNGILDAALAEMKNGSELQKTGRGLVDMPAKHPKEIPPQIEIPKEGKATTEPKMVPRAERVSAEVKAENTKGVKEDPQTNLKGSKTLENKEKEVKKDLQIDPKESKTPENKEKEVTVTPKIKKDKKSTKSSIFKPKQ